MIDLSALSPEEAALVDEFAATLRQAREEETEKLWRNVLELLRDGADALIADMRAVARARPDVGG
jgi:hypothetical protein